MKPNYSLNVGRALARHVGLKPDLPFCGAGFYSVALSTLLLAAAPLTEADELGRLFFTPEQRAQLDYNYARTAQPDSNGGSGYSLMLNGIVQKHGGKRTVWINGVPQQGGSSDDKAPNSMSVPVPGQSKQIRIKVGQRVLLSPSAEPETTAPDATKPDAP